MRTALIGSVAVAVGVLVGGGSQPAVAQTPPPQVQNLGVVADTMGVALDGGGFTYTVNEASQLQDLNGDGDAEHDWVIHRVDPTGAYTNLGIAIFKGSERALDGGGFTFLADECHQGSCLDLNGDEDLDDPGEGNDLNGDGDFDDRVVHRVEPTGAVTNLGIASRWTYALDGGGFAFVAANTGIVHRVSPTGSVDSLGIAASPLGWELVPLDGGGFLFGTGDRHQLHLVDPTGDVTNLGIMRDLAPVALDGGGFMFNVEECGPPTCRDLNGDGDFDDSLVHRADPTGALTNLALVGHVGVALDGGGFTFTVEECESARCEDLDHDGRISPRGGEGLDFNGDSDASDVVQHRFDPAGGVVNLRIAVAPEEGAMALEGGGFLFVAAEAQSSGSVLHRVDATGAVTNLGMALHASRFITAVALDGGGFALVDNDSMVRWAGPGGAVTSLGVAPRSPDPALVALDGGFAFVVDESQQGDLNGDGDNSDDVIYVVDPAGAVTNVAIATFRPLPLDGGGFLFLASETGQGQDLNGDGKVDLGVLHRFGGPRVTGSLAISKVFNPLTSGESRAFPINWSCDNGSSGTVELSGGESATVTPIPVGSVCSVTETRPSDAPAGWYYANPTVTGSPTTITAGNPAAVTVTNRIMSDVSSLEISKVFNPLTSGESRAFPINWSCDNGSSGTVELSGGESATVTPIPVGSVCSVTETRPSDAPAGWYYANPTVTGSPTTITADNPAAVTVTNRIIRSTSSLRITKVVNGAPAGFARFPRMFAVRVVCSGDGGSYDRTILYPVARSVTIRGIPTLTRCRVSETRLPAAPAGFQWAAPTFSGNPATIVSGRIAAVTVRNRLVDIAAPRATFTSPGADDPLLTRSPILLEGTATDNFRVVSVRAAIRDRATGLYLNSTGSWVSAYATLPTTLTAPGAANTGWSISRALPDGNYSIELVVTDTAGNRTTPSPIRDFRVDAP